MQQKKKSEDLISLSSEEDSRLREVRIIEVKRPNAETTFRRSRKGRKLGKNVTKKGLKSVKKGNNLHETRGRPKKSAEQKKTTVKHKKAPSKTTPKTKPTKKPNIKSKSPAKRTTRTSQKSMETSADEPIMV